MARPVLLAVAVLGPWLLQPCCGAVVSHRLGRHHQSNVEESSRGVFDDATADSDSDSDSVVENYQADLPSAQSAGEAPVRLSVAGAGEPDTPLQHQLQEKKSLEDLVNAYDTQVFGEAESSRRATERLTKISQEAIASERAKHQKQLRDVMGAAAVSSRHAAELRDALKDEHKRRETAETSIEAVRRQLRAAQEKNSKLERSLASITSDEKEMAAKTQRQKTALSDAVAELLASNEQLKQAQQQVSHLKEQDARLASEVKASKMAAANAEQKQAATQQALRGLVTDLTAAERKSKEQDASLQAAMKELQAAKAESEHLLKTQHSLMSELTAEDGAAERAKSLAQQVSDLQAQLHKEAADRQAISDSEHSEAGSLQSLQKRSNFLWDALRGASSQLEAAQRREAGLEAKLRGDAKDSSTTSKEIAALKEAAEAERKERASAELKLTSELTAKLAAADKKAQALQKELDVQSRQLANAKSQSATAAAEESPFAEVLSDTAKLLQATSAETEELTQDNERILASELDAEKSLKAKEEELTKTKAMVQARNVAIRRLGQALNSSVDAASSDAVAVPAPREHGAMPSKAALMASLRTEMQALKLSSPAQYEDVLKLFITQQAHRDLLHVLANCHKVNSSTPKVPKAKSSHKGQQASPQSLLLRAKLRHALRELQTLRTKVAHVESQLRSGNADVMKMVKAVPRERAAMQFLQKTEVAFGSHLEKLSSSAQIVAEAVTRYRASAAEAELTRQALSWERPASIQDFYDQIVQESNELMSVLTTASDATSHLNGMRAALS